MPAADARGPAAQNARRVRRKRRVPSTPADVRSENTRTPPKPAQDLRSPDARDRQTPAEREANRQSVATEVRDARIRVLRKRRKQIDPGEVADAVVGQVKKELEGRGALAKALGEGSKLAVRGNPTLAISSLTSAARGKPKEDLAHRAFKDAVNFPAQVAPSLYVPIAGVVEAAQGRPQRLKQFGKDIQEGDPLYALATGDVGRAKDLAAEHPGYALIEAYGAKGTVGRGAGRVMRSGVAGKKLKRVAATERAPKTLEGTNITEPRRWSKDVIKKGEQVARERFDRSQVENLRRKADEIEHRNPERAAEMRAEANRKDPTRVQPREVERQVDERVQLNEDLRRRHRDDVLRRVHEALKPAKGRESAVSLVTQRIADADAEDLAAYRDLLADEYEALGPAARRANKDLRRRIDHAITHRKGLDGVKEAADAYGEVIRPLQAKLVREGLLDPDQAERAAVIPYAVRRMGAKHEPEHWVDKSGNRADMGEILRLRREDPTAARERFTHVPARIVGPDGSNLTTAEIVAHMEARGVDPAAFVTQAPNQRGGRNFNIRSERAPSLATRRRTGEATRTGTFDIHPDTLAEGAARAQGLADAVDGFQGFVNELAVRGKSGKVKTVTTYSRAQQVAADLEAETGHKFQPIRVQPFGAHRERLQRLLDETDAVGQLESGDSPVRQAILDAIDGQGGEGPWAIVPESAARRLREHLNVQGAGTAAKTWQLVNAAFRKTVLSTSTTWLAGNITEATFRTALHGAGPRSYLTARRALARLKEEDPKTFEEVQARIIGGGHFGMASRSHVRRDASQFADTALEPVAQVLGKFWRSPGAKQTADLWHAWTELVFKQVNGRIESAFQATMLGKELRDAGMKAVDDAAAGLRNTSNQIAFGRAVDRAYGKYSKWSPDMRKALVLYTPFVAWSANAVKFVTDVLPRDHPTATALIASAEQATEEWRKEHGLDLFVEGALPGFLQGSIPVADGGKLRVSRFLPFGAFGDLGGTAAGNVLPQISGPLMALRGLDWKGDKLRTPDGSKPDPLQLAGIAAHEFAKATIPVLAQAERVNDKGVGAFNPFAPVRPPKKKLKVNRAVVPTPRGAPRGGFLSGSGGGSRGVPSGGFLSNETRGRGVPSGGFLNNP